MIFLLLVLNKFCFVTVAARRRHVKCPIPSSSSSSPCKLSCSTLLVSSFLCRLSNSSRALQQFSSPAVCRLYGCIFFILCRLHRGVGAFTARDYLRRGAGWDACAWQITHGAALHYIQNTPLSPTTEGKEGEEREKCS